MKTITSKASTILLTLLTLFVLLGSYSAIFADPTTETLDDNAIIIHEEELPSTSSGDQESLHIPQGTPFAIELSDQRVESIISNHSKTWSFKEVTTTPKLEKELNHDPSPDLVLETNKQDLRIWWNWGTVMQTPKRWYFQATHSGKATLSFSAMLRNYSSSYADAATTLDIPIEIDPTPKSQ